MNETYKKILLGGLSIAILAAAWFLVVKPTNEDTAAIQREVTTLRAHYNELLEKEVNRQQYLDDTASYRTLYADKLDEFPSNWNQEYQIEFIEGVRKNDGIDYDVDNLGMQKETSFYSIGGSNSEGSLTEDASSSTVATGYQCYKTTMTLSYKGSYEGIKSFMDYVASFPYRMTIDTVSIAADGEDTDSYSGSMSVDVYCIVGNDREEQFDIDLDDVKTGVDNLFVGGEGASTVSKYAADNGEAIKSDYDLYIAVNPTSSDTSGKLVGLQSGGTNVTSSKNESEAVSVKVTQDGDTYTVEYAIGTDKQTQTFEPGDDLTLLVQSSDVKDTSDVNAITLSLDNSSDKTLYVKVVDDGTANRIKITNKAGSVVVYK